MVSLKKFARFRGFERRVLWTLALAAAFSVPIFSDTAPAIDRKIVPIPYKPDPDAFESGVRAYDSGDYEEAYKIWFPMARAGDLAAMRNVGHLLRRGLGVEQDLKRARRFYRRAAKRGLVGAQANLALMLLYGEGTKPNPKEAARWFYFAARGGHIRSTVELAKLLEKGNGVPENDEAAIALYARAAAAGFEPAFGPLARLQAELGLPLAVRAPGRGAPSLGLAGGMIPIPVPKPSSPKRLPPLSLRGPLPIDWSILQMPPSEDDPFDPVGSSFAKGIDCAAPAGPIGPVWVPCTTRRIFEIMRY